jgi:uncharacterized membrane protein
LIPFLVLLFGTLVFRLLSLTGILFFASWQHALRAGLALMFFLTASAHWGRKRADLLQMVPPRIPFPRLMVTLTGLAEIAGAGGILWQRTAPLAAVGLMLLLLAVFPANVYAARHSMTVGGSKVTGLPLRTILQVVFLLTTFAAGFGFSYLGYISL